MLPGNLGREKPECIQEHRWKVEPWAQVGQEYLLGEKAAGWKGARTLGLAILGELADSMPCSL